MTAVKTVAATAGPSAGSPVPPTMEWWFDLKSAPMTERMTIAKAEMTTLAQSQLELQCLDMGRTRLGRPGIVLPAPRLADAEEGLHDCWICRSSAMTLKQKARSVCSLGIGVEVAWMVWGGFVMK
jgi:hypothetical protein